MGAYLCAASVRGLGHIESGTPNQDAVLTRKWNSSWLAVVSDGMGSKPHSEIGSRCACRAVLMAVKSLPFAVTDNDLIHCIYKNWLGLLGDIKPNDAVATCLVAWGQANGKTRLLQLGDGTILYHANEKGSLSERPEYGFGNETTGLGISRKYSDWACKQILLTKLGQGVALMTDGISDDLEHIDDFLPFMVQQMKGMGMRYGKQWITNELKAWPTPSNTDDKSIALIYRK
ncbi:PP2C family serine/threonine-protein phosphatase [Photobacterium sp. J15]|uniref:PP2C family serine/threonine-protein phosphatase n=1 Tax=Photobacterium sp. J15 TaxID=265901 RepID=UPI0007E3F23A|nr:PP2C family serine/threonine-protein phosphatase [Photobacterium sp. J15]